MATNLVNPVSVLTAVATVNTTSGTAIDFTGIPSGVKRITIIFNGVSTSGTSNYLVRIGSGSVDTSGYNSVGQRSGASTSIEATSTSGFIINTASATHSVIGTLILSRQDLTWIASGLFSDPVGLGTFISNGNKTLSGDLDRIRLTTVIGTDTFDAGSMNILYE